MALSFLKPKPKRYVVPTGQRVWDQIMGRTALRGNVTHTESPKPLTKRQRRRLRGK